jgi:hypothetical protein
MDSEKFVPNSEENRAVIFFDGRTLHYYFRRPPIIANAQQPSGQQPGIQQCLPFETAIEQDRLPQTTIEQDHPPRSAQFGLLLVPKRNREHLIGDLEEEYRTIVQPQYGRFLAGCWYCEQVAIAIGCYVGPTIKKILGLSVIFKLIGR